jgi:hypothetical protein
VSLVHFRYAEGNYLPTLLEEQIVLRGTLYDNRLDLRRRSLIKPYGRLQEFRDVRKSMDLGFFVLQVSRLRRDAPFFLSEAFVFNLP